MHAISLKGIAFQSIINIIEREPFHKASTTTTVSTKAGIKLVFSSIFLTFSFNIYICRILLFYLKN